MQPEGTWMEGALVAVGEPVESAFRAQLDNKRREHKITPHGKLAPMRFNERVLTLERPGSN
jgi:hypothetical protein